VHGLGDPTAARLVLLVQKLLAAETAVLTKKVYSTATRSLVKQQGTIKSYSAEVRRDQIKGKVW